MHRDARVFNKNEADANAAAISTANAGIRVQSITVTWIRGTNAVFLVFSGQLAGFLVVQDKRL